MKPRHGNNTQSIIRNTYVPVQLNRNCLFEPKII